MTRAVVFAYHNVGVRCLSVLLAAGVDVALVVTHRDDPKEKIWFSSVADLAARQGIPAITPARPDDPELLSELDRTPPDFIFSFYYRNMLNEGLLRSARLGAFNMHGSLLPRYRGRVPVNWVIINGESQTGASLHYMVAKPDAGDLVDQQAVPILPNDTALDVFNKVTWAAELVLHRSLPGILAGTAARTPLNLAAGSYYGRRRPEDGRIDWSAPASSIHNLIRAVAPPYPGAFSELRGHSVRFLRSYIAGEPARHAGRAPCIYAERGRCYVDAVDGRRLEVLDLEVDGRAATAEELLSLFGESPLPLGEAS